MPRPSYQYYPGDWRRDTALQSCTLAVRGLWHEMLNIMHDGEPYGHLTAGGVEITIEALARMVGGTQREVEAGVRELEAKHILSRTDAGVIYSRRMVRDEATRVARIKGGLGAPQPNRKGGLKGVSKGGWKGGAEGAGEGIPEGGGEGPNPTPFDPPPAFCSLHTASTPPIPPLEGGAPARVLRRHRAEAERIRDKSWGRCQHPEPCESREACIAQIARDLAEHAEGVA